MKKLLFSMIFVLICLLVAFFVPSTIISEQARRPPLKITTTTKDTVITPWYSATSVIGQEKPIYIFTTPLSESQMDSVLTRRAMLRLLEVYREYSEEGEIDTVMVGERFERTSLDSISNFPIFRYYKTEPTFTGFMQFLEEKYND